MGWPKLALFELVKSQFQKKEEVSVDLPSTESDPPPIKTDSKDAVSLPPNFEEEYEETLKRVEPTFKKASDLVDSSISQEFKVAQDRKKTPEFQSATKILNSVEENCWLAIDNRRNKWISRKRTSEAAKLRQLCDRLVKANNSVGSDARKFYDQAESVAQELRFDAAEQDCLKAEKILEEQQIKLDAEIQRVRDECNKKELVESRKQAFDFSVNSKGGKGFTTEDHAVDFYLANTLDRFGGKEKSETLKQMEALVNDAIQFKDKLIAAGATPEEAGEIAFQDIPPNFWPDSVLRETLMFARAQAAFEEDKKSKANLFRDLYDELEKDEGRVTDNELRLQFVSTAKDKFDSGHFGEDFDEDDRSKVTAFLESDGFFEYQRVTQGLRVAVEGGKAVMAHMKGQDEVLGPVQKLTADFKRNEAALKMLNGLVDLGLSAASQAVPLLGAVLRGKEAIQNMYDAAIYFKELSAISDLEKGAKADPHSMMQLPLAHEARKRKLKASQKTVDFAANLMQCVGRSMEMAGGADMGSGVIVDATGRALSFAGKGIFKSIDWHDAKKAQKTLRKAAGPPPDRKSQIDIFKDHKKYATYALAYGAVEGNDPWAMRYIKELAKLDDPELKDDRTSVKVLREYLIAISGDQEDPQAFSDTGIAKKTKQAAEFVGSKISKAIDAAHDKLIDRDTSIKYDDKWKPSDIELTRKNWEQTVETAISKGLYDTRKQPSKAFSHYEGAFSFYESNDNQNRQTAAAVVEALDYLHSELMGIQPLANDKKTIHSGMSFYVSELQRKVNDQIEKVRGELEKIIGQDKDLDQVMRDAIQAEENKREEKVAAIRKEITTEFNKQKFDIFGGSTISNIANNAANKLGLVAKQRSDLDVDMQEIEDECIERILNLVSALPLGSELTKGIKEQVKVIPKKYLEPIRALCDSYYQEYRVTNPILDTDVSNDWIPPNFDLTPGGWAKVRRDAVDNGQLFEPNGGFGLTPALENYSKGLSDKKETGPRKVEAALNEVINKLKSMKLLVAEVDMPHQGMIAYRDQLAIKASAELKKYMS